jgi:hypothetical protein
MQSKLKYVSHMQKMGARPEKNCFRVYAYKDHAMRLSAWKSIFKEPVYVEKMKRPLQRKCSFR